MDYSGDYNSRYDQYDNDEFGGIPRNLDRNHRNLDQYNDRRSGSVQKDLARNHDYTSGRGPQYDGGYEHQIGDLSSRYQTGQQDLSTPRSDNTRPTRPIHNHHNDRYTGDRAGNNEHDQWGDPFINNSGGDYPIHDDFHMSGGQEHYRVESRDHHRDLRYGQHGTDPYRDQFSVDTSYQPDPGLHGTRNDDYLNENNDFYENQKSFDKNSEYDGGLLHGLEYRESTKGYRDSGLYENPDDAFSPLEHRRSAVYDNYGYEDDEGEAPHFHQNRASNVLRKRSRKSKKSKLVIEDGSFTVAFRKRKNSGDNRISTRRSTVNRKSLIQEGYVPSHSAKTLTLKERMKILKEQESVEGVANVYREKIIQEPELKVGGFAGWRHRQAKNWNEFKQACISVYRALELWSSSFRTIEGRFGTAIMNYFRFIRWLMYMNLYMAIITIGATLVPQALLPTARYNETEYNQTKNCTDQYDQDINRLRESEDAGKLVLDVIQGTGWMEQTLLFYGAYNNRTMLDDTTQYNMSLAYLLAVGGAFLVSFFLIVRNTGKGMKEGVMNRDSTINQYTNKTLCGGWDFCINEAKAAKRRHKNILQELQGDLLMQRLFWKKQNRSFKEKFILFTIRTVVNVVVLAVLGGSLYLIFYTNDKMLQLQKEQGYHAIVEALIQYMPSITITVLNVIVPLICVKLVALEDYTPAYEIRLTLLRIILLRLASLGVLIGSLYRIITTEENTVTRCGNSRWEGSNINSTDKNNIKCWETYVGQQFYKLIILDFLVGVISVFAAEFPRRIIYNKYHKTSKLVNMIGQLEFDLPKVVLHIVYSQTLCWIGLFFCPLTPVITFLKCFIFFYVRKISLLRNCVQPVRPYRTSRSNSLFAAVLFLSFLLSSIPLAILLAIFPPSQSCGPFRLYNGAFVFFDTIPYTINTWPSAAVDVFYFIGSEVFMVPAIFIVCFVMYVYWTAKEGSKRETELLQDELTQEGRDKQFLVAQVNDILQHLEATSS